MTTKIIGIKNFRQNLSNLWREARKQKIKYILMYHTKPVFELTPILEDELKFDTLAEEIKEARAQIKRGEIYTEDEVYKQF